jgi:SGNH hydrolase-like domain, acetyltransferase AlgX
MPNTSAPRYFRYLMLLVCPIGLLSLFCVAVSVWLQPLSNDLTRLGGYSENAYGWNSEQIGFSPPLASVGVLGQSYDAVVVGDSFSIDERLSPDAKRNDHGYWTDFFVQKTGLTLGSFHRGRISPEDYVASTEFRKTPPKLLVFEIAEREIVGFPVRQEPCPAPRPGQNFHLSLHPVARAPVGFARDTSRRLSTSQIDTAIDFLKKSTQRWVTGHNSTKVLRVSLSRADLFSNQSPGNLLVYTGDLRKSEFSDQYLESVGCAFLAFQARVEANGLTAFVLMIAPDRSTAYADFTPDLRLPNLTNILAGNKDLHLLRVDVSLKQAIALGRLDVYLPNDTHWAGAGKQIVAETLVSYLRSTPIVGSINANTK